ncbi:MAG: formamidopyrimidine-DNA glycosylase [Spirochaetes bacterium RBG_16_49_21]|nr:MAG: formamidopyrimidine-DNA glycosylase [Spirochaetes bacterium RBG_16_49_21]
MPEYPDITVYIERLEDLLKNQVLEKVRLLSPFFLRSVDPPVSSIEGLTLRHFRRMGKRIVFSLADDYYLIIHLMIAGRLYWKKKGVAVPRKNGLAAFDFSNGSLLVIEHSTKKRASLHIIHGASSLEEFDPGGLEIFEASLHEFRERLVSENHTLKRALTDPRLFSGIGNAYSDEILHRARLSPLRLTQKMDDEQVERLFDAAKTVLQEWTARLREETGRGFPEKVTAFHEDMAVHGRYKKPCPVCNTQIQRIQYAENETDYCPRCQTGGKLLADRVLSQLLKKDWPRAIEELEGKK